jgi:uncharacterized cupin superfamily protein
MRRWNVADPAFGYDDEDPEGYKAGLFRPGRDAGAEDTGTSVYDVPPGQSICPYHYEVGEEEWLLVLSGRPTLRTPEGEQVLEPLDLVFFPLGPEGAHKVSNATAEPCRVVMFSNLLRVTGSVYPDSDKVGLFMRGGGDNVLVRRSSDVPYYDGEA